jgi:catechol 2,3-dioxygenase-like lactoylglutathione lyase family enzyme
VLRIFDAELGVRFYCEYLGFVVDWEHRFEPDLPLYMQVSRDDAVLHLSEHYGDGTPGSGVWVAVDDLPALHRELRQRDDLGRQRPGIDADAPGGPTMAVIDPFGNVLRFCQQS